MTKIKKNIQAVLLVFLALGLLTVPKSHATEGRTAMFIGMDISGSFLRSKSFENALEFLAHYIYGHLNNIQGMAAPKELFISSIGGVRAGEPKTFFPIQMFQNKSVSEIHAKLKEYYPRTKENPFTDFNAFFEQVALTAQNKKLILRPMSIVLISDGIPDVAKGAKTSAYRGINLDPLERLSRNITIRLLYTNATVGKRWQTEVPRKRVKIWTQDSVVMDQWKDPDIFQPELPMEKKNRFISWIQDNVDFGVRARRVD